MQPQFGDGASSPLKDAHGAGVTNVRVQDACPGQVAGSFYTHEGIPYNPLAYALARDAVLNDGTGQLSRLDLTSICGNYLAPTLTLEDFLLTENTAVVAAVLTLLYDGKSTSEPAIAGKFVCRRGFEDERLMNCRLCEIEDDDNRQGILARRSLFVRGKKGNKIVETPLLSHLQKIMFDRRLHPRKYQQRA